jgi:hypothetical protein
MITGESAKDILDADRARRDAGLDSLLTDAGRRAMENVVLISRPLPQEDIDKIIRSTLKRKPHEKPFRLPPTMAARLAKNSPRKTRARAV